MKRIANLFLFFVLCIGVNRQTFAQTDPHFTQNYMFPMAVNPALTGSMDGSYRVASIYRNQWRNITNPYQTIGFSAEIATSKDINIGASFFKETAGYSGYQYSLSNLSLAYTGVRFGKTGDQQISFGAQSGFVSAKYNFNNFEFGQQWLSGTGYVPGTSSGENFENLSVLVPDISFGISYFDRTPNKAVSAYGGVAVYHLTQPRFSFLGGNNKLPARISAQAGLKVVLNDGVFLMPNVVYNRPQNASEIIPAAYAQFYVNDDTDIMLGGNIRIKDAVSPFIGLYFKGLVAGLSYDINTSALANYAPNSNAFELSVSFSGGRARQANSTYFNCPRF